ncbi:flagellar hook assembly protein FlgD [Salinarimonas soli]|uniref:Basal-body rod modification protein FlgD n=1 Tax=Salinarimonas soli TaxID=1638099 RepID=A0A5B2V6X6_9HYPH|nr:flagellar hook assembly protein FlgD [Salinarimonas soli]KAA2234714.1 flagellar hook assembly protein FlgD [Salinarimonas soli]
MQVNAAPPTAGAPAGTAPPRSNKMDYDAFLRLLVAEMKNQDPTNPMKGTEQVAQFAQFALVEQSLNANKKLDSLLSASALTQATGMIGREVSSADGSVTGKVASIRIAESGAVATLSDGRTLPLGPGVSIR